MLKDSTKPFSKIVISIYTPITSGVLFFFFSLVFNSMSFRPLFLLNFRFTLIFTAASENDEVLQSKMSHCGCSSGKSSRGNEPAKGKGLTVQRLNLGPRTTQGWDYREKAAVSQRGRCPGNTRWCFALQPVQQLSGPPAISRSVLPRPIQPSV